MPELFKSYAVNVASTAQSTLVSSVGGTSIINAINVTNVSTASTASFSILLTRDSSTFTIAKNVTLATSASSQVLSRPIPIASGDVVNFSQGSTAASLDIISSVLEIT